MQGACTQNLHGGLVNGGHGCVSHGTGVGKTAGVLLRVARHGGDIFFLHFLAVLLAKSLEPFRNTHVLRQDIDGRNSLFGSFVSAQAVGDLAKNCLLYTSRCV